MSRKNELEAQRESSMQLTAGGVPADITFTIKNAK